MRSGSFVRASDRIALDRDPGAPGKGLARLQAGLLLASLRGDFFMKGKKGIDAWSAARAGSGVTLERHRVQHVPYCASTYCLQVGLHEAGE
jgi:hypothetical protein